MIQWFHCVGKVKAIWKRYGAVQKIKNWKGVSNTHTTELSTAIKLL